MSVEAVGAFPGLILADNFVDLGLINNFSTGPQNGPIKSDFSTSFEVMGSRVINFPRRPLRHEARKRACGANSWTMHFERSQVNAARSFGRATSGQDWARFGNIDLFFCPLFPKWPQFIVFAVQNDTFSPSARLSLFNIGWSVCLVARLLCRLVST